MTLYDKLNNPFISDYIMKEIDKKLSTKEFWEEDEKRYLQYMGYMKFEERPRMKNSVSKPECMLSTNT